MVKKILSCRVSSSPVESCLVQSRLVSPSHATSVKIKENLVLSRPIPSGLIASGPVVSCRVSIINRSLKVVEEILSCLIELSLVISCPVPSRLVESSHTQSLL